MSLGKMSLERPDYAKQKRRFFPLGKCQLVFQWFSVGVQHDFHILKIRIAERLEQHGLQKNRYHILKISFEFTVLS